MLQTFQLKDLFLGNIDAKNELITNSDEERQRFVNSFFIPENIFINDFLEGKTYFIRGIS
ncbi:hypothetical protein KM792_14975 [Clostridium tyrobutyricum]|uniref:hypothetical protein n=1 Tax=Clostridium tyrobutyricum TaxID=1519 RepID=UPI001C3840F3|nr:hypothetical protein [Clostridium tyrobutyricum]MBV4450937.1 hypothetical protein [Clostridium tyrobutyricum]